MTAVTKTIVVLIVVGVTSLFTYFHNKSSNQPQTVQSYLSDIQYSIDAACVVTALDPPDCTLANDALTAAVSIANHSTNVKVDVKKSLIDFESRLPSNSMVKPYFDWLIALL